jgi:AbrB family looped-hinge helix DNA binding protein
MGIWTAKVSPKGWIVIPAELRRKLGIRPGDTVQFFESGDGVFIAPSSPNPIDDLIGCAEGDWTVDDWLEERRVDERERERKWGVMFDDEAPPAHREARHRPESPNARASSRG